MKDYGVLKQRDDGKIVLNLINGHSEIELKDSEEEQLKPLLQLGSSVVVPVDELGRLATPDPFMQQDSLETLIDSEEGAEHA